MKNEIQANTEDPTATGLCPFCGSHRTAYTADNGVECESCGAKTVFQNVRNFRDVAAKWNHRA